jgi:hypothetical protein
LQEPAGVHHAIKAHTLVPHPPRTREAWVVIAADLLTSAQECGLVISRARRRARERLRRHLERRRHALARMVSLRRAAPPAAPGMITGYERRASDALAAGARPS